MKIAVRRSFITSIARRACGVAVLVADVARRRRADAEKPLEVCGAPPELVGPAPGLLLLAAWMVGVRFGGTLAARAVVRPGVRIVKLSNSEVASVLPLLLPSSRG